MRVEILTVIHPEMRWRCSVAHVRHGKRHYYFTPGCGTGRKVFRPDEQLEILSVDGTLELPDNIVRAVIAAARAEEQMRSLVASYLAENYRLFQLSR